MKPRASSAPSDDIDACRLPPDAATSPISLAALYRHLWTYAAGARGWLLLSSAMLLSSQFVKLLVPWFAAQAIEALQRSGANDSASAALPWIGGIVAVSAGGWLLHGPGRVIERSVAVRVRRALTDRLYDRVSRAPLAWHEAQHSAELSHRISQASHALTNFTQSQFVYLQSAANLFGPLVALSLLSGLIGGIACVGLMAVALTIVAFDRALMRLANEENGAERRLAAALLDCLTNVATVLSLRLRDSTRRLLMRRLDAVVAPLKRSMGLAEWKWCAVDLLTVTLSWGLVVVYAWQATTRDALLLGGVFMVYQYAQQCGGVIGSLASNLQNFTRIRADYASAAPIWAAPQQRADPAAADSSGWRQIDLCDLSLAHAPENAGDDAPRGGLHHITLRLHAGERIALVGPSGAGKTTLLRLMAGLYAPNQGHVEVDGAVSPGMRDLATRSTLVPQEAQVFEASVRENVAFDLPFTDADVMAAAHTSSFDAVIETLPLGLATPITQGGFNLSGGQRQRLCLTRAVLAARGSTVLLLDEPTSALDQATEATVYERLAEAFPAACIVASVHRMSLLSRFDRIVLMRSGAIVDEGTAAELQRRQPLFRELLGSQTSDDEPPADGNR
jgi:ATP-binding cassette, subfamily B, bacterial